ncbi:MAG: family 78 glycoside hydrolase catalytic domain [Cytophagales bacterium]|nr:family 78 glycoside hydrolase catalytic domain [Armatimonadota bacterium]
MTAASSPATSLSAGTDSTGNTDDLRVTHLRCEYRENPLGIDIAVPRLSWRIGSGVRGTVQAAYQILVAASREALSTDKADLWDSGRVSSDQTALVEYAGAPLGSEQAACWKVRAWSENGQISPWSAVSEWETGLLLRADWDGASWIGGDLTGGPRTSIPAPFLRREFVLPQGKRIASARLYATARGLYELRLNGAVVGDDVFTPGWTEYRKRVVYQTYDVTRLLRAGEDNALGAMLGDGWYCGYVGGGGRQLYGDRPALLARLVVRFDDGTQEVILTDDRWRVAYGPLLEADLLSGESWDARREMPGWDTPNFAEGADWRKGTTVPDDSSVMRVARRGPAVKRTEEVSPIADPAALPRWPAPDYIFDLGQNLVGRVRLRVKGAAGTTVRLRFAEVLEGGPASATGSLYTANLRGARCTDFYTLRGDPDGEVYEPHFTFHGFRYVEMSTFPPSHPTTQAYQKPEPPLRDTITGVVLHSEIPQTGGFECSDPLLNQLQKNIDWGLRGNFLEVPTDCPQRDERLGWTGDAQVFIRTAAFNRDVAAFFTKWQDDIADAQSDRGAIPSVVPNSDAAAGSDGGPAWSDAVILCPWTLYRCYGDTRILAEHYDSLVRFLDYLATRSRDFIRSYEGMDGFRGFGDWLSINADTPQDLIGTAFYAHDAHLMSKIATVLGKAEDAAKYAALFETVREAFVKQFVQEDGTVGSGTQTAQVLALHFDLLPVALRPAAADRLVADIEARGKRLSTGFVGSPYLNAVLSRFGKWETAFALLHQTEWPSWLYAVTQGATTIWERWDGWTHDKGFQDAGMNSFNHYAYGAIGAWLYETVAGIELDPEIPGYKRFVIHPHAAGSGLTHCRAWLDSPHGRIVSAWRLEKGIFTLDTTIPPNTRATIFVPTPDPATVTESGAPAAEAQGIRWLRHEEGFAVFEAGSGDYRFAAAA